MKQQLYSADIIKQKLLPIFAKTPVSKAILFGSYAKGTPTQVSDIDILIDSDGKLHGIDFFGVLEEITQAIQKPIDLIEMSQLVHGGKIEREINESGVVIYERT